MAACAVLALGNCILVAIAFQEPRVSAWVCAVFWLTWWAVWLVIGTTAKRNVHVESFFCRLPHLALLVLGVGLTYFELVFHDPYRIGSPDWMRQVATSAIALGFLLASWARYHLGRNWSGLVTIKERHELVTTGPYKYVRHPIYAGLIFSMIMTALAINTLTAMIGALLCFVAFVIKAKHEEKLLSDAFGAEYARLCSEVPSRIIPGMF